MSTTIKALYDTDFARWADETAELVRAGHLDEVDLENLAEEIEALARGERRAVRLQLKSMLLYLIKQQLQPERDEPTWRVAVVEAQQDMDDSLKDSPSLRTYLTAKLQETDAKAVELALIETGARTTLPKQCPYTLEELLTLP